MAQEHWKVNPGRRPVPKTPLNEFLTRAYQADEWVRQTYRNEPLDQRMTKDRFCSRIKITKPTVNKYLRGGGIPFPLPPQNHVVWVVDAEDHTVLWVNAKLCDTLRHDEDFYVGQDASVTLRGAQASEPGHLEALQALRRDEIDVHECTTTFVRDDGWLVPLAISVYYGPLYRVWFAVGVPSGDPIAPAVSNHELVNTHNTILVDTTINPGYRLTLDPQLLQRPIFEVNGFVYFPPMPTITVTPSSIVLEADGTMTVKPRKQTG